MSRSRKPKPFGPLAEGEPLETTHEFALLENELRDTGNTLIEHNAQAYLDGITDLRLTKEAERAAEGWPT